MAVTIIINLKPPNLSIQEKYSLSITEKKIQKVKLKESSTDHCSSNMNTSLVKLTRCIYMYCTALRMPQKKNKPYHWRQTKENDTAPTSLKERGKGHGVKTPQTDESRNNG